MKHIEITWLDAAYNQSSWSRKELHKDFGLVRLSSTGWLVEERLDCYILATEYTPDDDTFRHIVAIPKSCIETVKIEEANK